MIFQSSWHPAGQRVFCSWGNWSSENCVRSQSCNWQRWGSPAPSNLSHLPSSHLPPTLCHLEPLWHPGFLRYVPGTLLLQRVCSSSLSLECSSLTFPLSWGLLRVVQISARKQTSDNPTASCHLQAPSCSSIVFNTIQLYITNSFAHSSSGLLH